MSTNYSIWLFLDEITEEVLAMPYHVAALDYFSITGSGYFQTQQVLWFWTRRNFSLRQIERTQPVLNLLINCSNLKYGTFKERFPLFSLFLFLAPFVNQCHCKSHLSVFLSSRQTTFSLVTAPYSCFWKLSWGLWWHFAVH